MDDFFLFFRKIGFLGILGPPYCGIGATIRIGREMLCLPYAGFFTRELFSFIRVSSVMVLYDIAFLFFLISPVSVSMLTFSGQGVLDKRESF